MALTGTWTKYTTSNGEVLSSSSVTYPADLSDDHPDFINAGTTEIVNVYETIITSQSFDDAYVNLYQVNVFKSQANDGGCFLDYEYRVYGSEASKSADIDNYIHKESNMIIHDFEVATSNHVQAYNHLKTQAGCEALTDTI
tara:strand:+ start:5351 stop:5773 length:423 start_codon:yes stop_codon:yes gene_type:complete